MQARPSPPSHSSPPRRCELELAGRILRGERHAAEELLDTHLEPLYEFVHWRLGPARTGAEDLVQDTFVVALEKLSDFDGRSSLHTWLCGIAKNRIRAARRERARTHVPIDELLEQADPEIERILVDLEREELPESVLDRAETRELVGAALSSLPPDYRSALLGKYVDELPVSEIAARGGRSEKAAESLLTRARLAFARVFELLAKRRGGLE